MAVQAIDPQTQPFFAAGDLASESSLLPAGWDLARRWGEIHSLFPGERTREAAESAAISAVLRRARDLLHHAPRPRRVVSDSWPAPGLLDLDRTVDHLPVRRPEDIAVERHEHFERPAVAMLDISLSMTGDKIALLAISTAILRLALGRLAVVAFDTAAHLLVRIDEDIGPRALVRRVLSFPPRGYTNIEAGLRAGLGELRYLPRRRRVGLLLTDGLPNVGWDPLDAARRFPRLHVVRLGPPSPDAVRTCRALARAGRGHVYPAERWDVLPSTVRDVVRAVFRR